MIPSHAVCPVCRVYPGDVLMGIAIAAVSCFIQLAMLVLLQTHTCSWFSNSCCRPNIMEPVLLLVMPSFDSSTSSPFA